jgi:hypothetical protein
MIVNPVRAASTGCGSAPGGTLPHSPTDVSDVLAVCLKAPERVVVLDPAALRFQTGSYPGRLNCRLACAMTFKVPSSVSNT